MSKCGNTAMWHYFDLLHLRMTRTLAYWLESQSPKIVVLRHPAQRMHAAIAFYDKLWNSQIVEYEKNGTHDNLHMFKHFIGNPLEVDTWIFDQHCRPYMNIIKSRDFRIIKFEDLSQYIPKINPCNIEINPANKGIDPFPKNRYFKREDMLREIELYENLVASREVITPEEWKELT
jgi:hypothetical protein